MNWQWIKAFRLLEVSLMTGFFIIGSFFAIEEWTTPTLWKLLIVTAISFFTILSIYAYNSAAGKTVDEYNIRLESLRTYSRARYIIFGSIFLSIAISLCIFIDVWFLLTNLVVFGIWVLYSQPRWGLKHTALWGTVLHFVAQIIHFNMYYYAFRPIDQYSFTLSIYFAIAFATGHLNHEIIDYESDKRAGVRNTATKMGVRFVSGSILVLCIINLLFVSAASYFKAIDVISGLLLLLPVVLHILLYNLYLKALPTGALKIRSIYRAVYFFCFLLLILYRVLDSFYDLY